MKKYVLTTALSLVSAGAFAQDYDMYDNSAEATNYESQLAANEAMVNQGVVESKTTNKLDAKITLGIANTPKYMGADGTETNPLILPDVKYHFDDNNRAYLSLEKGLGYSFDINDKYEIGGGLGYRMGRDSSDASILSGMRDVDDTLTYRAFLNYKINDNYGLGISMDKGMDSSNDGISSDIYADYKTQFNSQLALGAKATASYGNNTFMDQNFGVSSADATGGRPAFDADSGFYEASLKVYGDYQISGPHSITLFSKYSQLLGDAKDSSITEDDTNISVGGGYTYKF